MIQILGFISQDLMMRWLNVRKKGKLPFWGKAHMDLLIILFLPSPLQLSSLTFISVGLKRLMEMTMIFYNGWQGLLEQWAIIGMAKTHRLYRQSHILLPLGYGELERFAHIGWARGLANSTIINHSAINAIALLSRASTVTLRAIRYRFSDFSWISNKIKAARILFPAR